MNSQLHTKNFVQLASPIKDANYEFLVFEAADQEQLLKICVSSESFVPDKISEELNLQLETGTTLYKTSPDCFPEITKHKSGIAIRDFSMLSQCRLQRLPDLTPSIRRKLRSLVESNIQLQRELNTLSETFDTRLRKNKRHSLEIQEQKQYEKLQAYQKLESALNLLLSLCDAVERIHDNGQLHLEINSTTVGLDRDNRIKLLPSLGYSANSQLRRRHYTSGLSGQDILAPELLRGEPAQRSTDVYLIAKTFVNYLITLGGGRNSSAPTIHELQLVRRFIPESCSALIQPLQSALSDTPASRPQTPKQLSEMVASVFAASKELGGDPKTGEETAIASPIPSSRKSPIKQKAIIGMTAALVAMLGLIVVPGGEPDSNSTQGTVQQAAGDIAEAQQEPGKSLPTEHETLEVQPGIVRFSTHRPELAANVPPQAEALSVAPLPVESRESEHEGGGETETKADESSLNSIVAERPPRPKQSLVATAPVQASEPEPGNTDQYIVLLSRALSEHPQRLTAAPEVRLPKFTRDHNRSWLANYRLQPAICDEYIARFNNLAYVATHVKEGQSHLIVAQYRAACAIVPADFRLDLVAALGLERIGANKLAQAAYASANRKWQREAQYYKNTRTDLRAYELYVRMLAQQCDYDTVLAESKRLTEHFCATLPAEEAGASTLDSIAFLVARTEILASAPANKASARKTAVTIAKMLERGDHCKHFVKQLLAYRDMLANHSSKDSYELVCQLNYEAIINNLTPR